METETIRELWGRSNPQFETKYMEFINSYSDYGVGNSQYVDSRGKVFGAGYEVYLVAFFYGLYHDHRRPLVKDTSKRKKFGPPVSSWGQIEERNGRKPYSRLQDYVFAALMAKTDIDLIAVDKGEVEPKEVVARLKETMEEYANYGLYRMSEIQEESPEYFFQEGAFLKLFLQFIKDESDQGEGPEDLD